MKTGLFCATAFAATLLVTGSAAALDKIPMLSLDIAKRMADACEAMSVEKGWRMDIAIVDRGADLVVFRRMDNAFLGSVEIAINNNAEIPFEGAVPLVIDRLDNRGTDEVLVGFLGTFVWQPSDNHELALKVIANENREDQGRIQFEDPFIDDNGEVLFKSPGVFIEYFKNPEATAETKTAEGWVHTGDAGFFGDDGHLKIIDRAKDVGKLTDGSLFAPKYIENKLKFFPDIKEAVAFGQDRDYVTAFINIDLEAVGSWAERNNLAYASYQELAGDPRVYEIVKAHVERVNRDLAEDPHLSASQIKRFLILHKELDPDDGELTRTRKVRRRIIAERYEPLITALYSGADQAFIETQVTFEDGRTGKLSADLKMEAAETYAPLGEKSVGPGIESRGNPSQSY